MIILIVSKNTKMKKINETPQECDSCRCECDKKCHVVLLRSCFLFPTTNTRQWAQLDCYWVAGKYNWAL